MEVMKLSHREGLLVDTYVRSMSLKECQRVMKASGVECSLGVIVRWMRRSHIRDGIRGRIQEGAVVRGWTREHYFRYLIGLIEGEFVEASKNTPAYLKMLGEGMKYLDGVVNQVDARHVVIVQADGRE